jgi:hypothetical protein
MIRNFLLQNIRVSFNFFCQQKPNESDSLTPFDEVSDVADMHELVTRHVSPTSV